MNRTLALVESPSQLLNTIEWAHDAHAADQLRVIVLPPRDTVTRQQLGAVSELARASGITIEHTDIRVASPRSPIDLTHLVHRVRQAQRLVVGDPFSGLIQTLLPVATAADVVIVDDGTATIEFAACIDAGQPLRRWRKADPPSRRATRATGLLTPSSRRRISVFTALAGATPAGACALVNSYAWSRRAAAPRVLPGAVDLVGASLVETGVVDEDAYIDAVSSIVEDRGARRYFAHRRESTAKLAKIEERTGVEIRRPQLPVELTLRRGPVAVTVVTFPSTVAQTLPIVLAGTAVDVQVHAVQASWFSAQATAHARAFVHRIGQPGRDSSVVLERARH